MYAPLPSSRKNTTLAYGLEKQCQRMGAQT